jgi:hypothetical protein
MSLTTWAVPVLPPILASGRKSRLAVPPSTVSTMVSSRKPAVLVGQGQDPLDRGFLVLHQGGLEQPSAIEQGTDVSGHLQGRDQHVALADGGVEGLAPGPDLAEALLLHSREGISPAFSWGRSTPVGTPNPQALA